MVDKVLLATKIAAVRDAVARIRAVLPPDVGTFHSDRTVREVVVVNLFVALQECVSLAAHWLADQAMDVPQTYAEVFGAWAIAASSPQISRCAWRPRPDSAT